MGRRVTTTKSRVPVWALIVTAALPTLAAAGYFSLAGKQAWIAVGYGATKLFTVVWPWIASWWWRPPEPRPSIDHRRSALLGAASGALGAAALVALYWGPIHAAAVVAAPQIASKIEMLGLENRYLAFALFLSFLHSAIEEVYWRWFLYGHLQTRTSERSATSIASLAFAAHHFVILASFTSGIWVVVGGFAVAAAGALWCFLYAKTGSLLGSWISHVFLDLAIFWVGFELLRQVS